jgi:hypothetical protein
MWGVLLAPQDFSIISGNTSLVDYQPDNAHHLFCGKCGVRPFARGELNGQEYYVVRVYCLDDVDADELMNAPVKYYDGLHDNYESPPAETRHL